MTRIKAVMFDMIGTTVLERDPNVISKCFQDAFAEHGITVIATQIFDIRGKSKLEAIEEILRSSNNNPSLNISIFEAFKTNVRKNISNFVEHPDLAETLRELKQRKIRIGIASGLPEALFQLVFQHLGWQRSGFDYVNVYENFNRGRPDPAMILDMCSKLNIHPDNVLKVGDTVADINEGRNAGAVTPVVLTGTQPESKIRSAQPDFVFKTLRDVLSIIH